MPSGGKEMSDTLGKSKSYILAQLKNIRSGRIEDRREGKPFVTISRESGAYGTTVAGLLAEYLRKHERRTNCPWTVFDKDLIKQVIEDYEFPEEFEKYFVEIPVRPIQDTLEEIFGVHPGQETLVQKMNKTIFRLARLGYVILVGRGANIITRPLPMGVHVRLIGSLEKRTRHMQEHLKLGDERQAREHVIREQEDRRRYIRKYFNQDVADVSLYDLVINTDTVPLDEAVRIVGDFVLRGCARSSAQVSEAAS